MNTEQMMAKADEMTKESRLQGWMNREDAWLKFINPAVGEGVDYATKKVFERVCDYLKGRQQSIAQGVYLAYPFVMQSELAKILSFAFYYEYEMFEWSGKVDDSLSYETFPSFLTREELPLGEKKREVVAAFREFLLAGALQAKKIASDTYALWRKALMDVDYTYKGFGEVADEKTVKTFLDEVEHIAQMTAIDSEVHQRLTTPQPAQAKRPMSRNNGKRRTQK